MKRKIFFILCLLPFLAKAEIYQGSCGTSATYYLNTNDGVLHIDGTGELASNRPWYDFHNAVKVIQIGSGITSLGANYYYPFSCCTNCTSLVIDDSEYALKVPYGVHDYASWFDDVFPSSITTLYLGRNIDYGNYRRSEEFAYRAFQYKINLANITIGNKVTDLESDEFYGTAWWYAQAYNGNQIIHIGSIAYYCPTGVTNAIIKEGTTMIAGGCFQSNSLSSLSIPSSVKYVCEGALRYPRQVYVSLSSSNPYLTFENGVLYNKSKTIVYFGTSQTPASYTMPTTVEKVSNYAFSSIPFTTLTLPASLKEIGIKSFTGDISTLYYNCQNLHSGFDAVFIEDRGDEGWAYHYPFNGVHTFICGDGVTELDFRFGNYKIITSKTTSITIGKDVTTLKSGVFASAINLTSIYNKATTPQSITSDLFPTGLSCNLYVPNASIPAYRVADVWKNFNISTTDILVTNVSMNSPSATIELNKSLVLTATVAPSTATTKALVWKSSNTGVATVDNTGKVTAIGKGMAIITATATDGTGRFASCTVTVTNKGTINYKTDIAQSQWSQQNVYDDYTLDESCISALKVESEYNLETLSYTRNFTHTKWQPLYVPFKICAEEFEAAGLEVAKLNSAQVIDDDDDGIADKMQINFIKLKSGHTIPNRPYLVRARTEGEHRIEISDATIYKTSVESIDCSTTELTFTFIGTYAGVSGTEIYNNHYYVMSDGALCNAEGTSAHLKAFRWYMTITDRNSGYSLPILAKKINVVALGADEQTNIDTLTSQTPHSIYDITGKYMGTDLNTLPSGVYIVDGKKIIK